MSTMYASCHLCENPGEFQCTSCGLPTCGNDVRFRTICRHCIKPQTCEYQIHQAYCEDVENLEQLVLLFWGDPVQQMFDTSYRVAEQPAIVAESDNKLVGFIAYTNFNDTTVLIVAMGILPEYQGCGIGCALVQQVEQYTKSQAKQQLLVVTSNDNLPALGFYQRLGFQLFDVVPDVIAQKLGGLHKGIGNIPIRDELRLRKMLK